MFEGKSICVVVPAHNEELLIGRVIDTMPDFVDHIIIVDDTSTDQTVEIVERYVAERGASCTLPGEAGTNGETALTLLRHETNRGVGAAIATGYEWARDHEFDVTVVMAGDAQLVARLGQRGPIDSAQPVHHRAHGRGHGDRAETVGRRVADRAAVEVTAARCFCTAAADSMRRAALGWPGRYYRLYVTAPRCPRHDLRVRHFCQA